MNEQNDNDDARVLVVDDNVDVADVFAELLRANGYVVETANSGDLALEVAQQFKPHCVMLDIQMPSMSGLQLARQLRQVYGDDVVLIAVTGQRPSAPDVSETFGLVDHYLHKPFAAAELEKVLPPINTRQPGPVRTTEPRCH